MLPWVRQAFRLRPWAIEPALAALDELLGMGALRFSYSASGDEARADFGLDGNAFVRLTSIQPAFVGDVLQSLSRFGEELAASRNALAALRAAIDVSVGSLYFASALLAAARGGGLWDSTMRFAAVSVAYGVLIPFRNTLMQLLMRSLARVALRGIIS